MQFIYHSIWFCSLNTSKNSSIQSTFSKLHYITILDLWEAPFTFYWQFGHAYTIFFLNTKLVSTWPKKEWAFEINLEDNKLKEPWEGWAHIWDLRLMIAEGLQARLRSFSSWLSCGSRRWKLPCPLFQEYIVWFSASTSPFNIHSILSLYGLVWYHYLFKLSFSNLCNKVRNFKKSMSGNRPANKKLVTAINILPLFSWFWSGWNSFALALNAVCKNKVTLSHYCGYKIKQETTLKVTVRLDSIWFCTWYNLATSYMFNSHNMLL